MKKKNNLLLFKALVLTFFSVQSSVSASQFELEYIYGQAGQLEKLDSNWVGQDGSLFNVGVDFKHLPNGQIKSVAARECQNCEAENVKALQNFNLLGRASVAVWADGAQANYTYDSFNRLNEMQLMLPGISQAQYKLDSLTYDERGFVQGYRRSDPGLNNYVSFGYGKQGELAQWKVGSAQVDYAYDAQGNLTRRSGKVGSMPNNYQREYDQNNHAEGFLYDAMGRLIKDDLYQYSYNSAGRLALIQDVATDAVVAAYRYDANGMRVATMQNNKVTYSHRYGDTVLSQASLDHDGKLADSKLFVPMNDTVAQERTLNGDAVNYFQDRMGNPAVRWGGEDGVLLQEYSPYGQQVFTYASGAHQGPGGYTGTHEDDTTGLTYMRARYQSPIAGRFLSPDPARDFKAYLPSSFNLYQYTSNNPVNAWDPSGLQEEGEASKEQTPDESEQDQTENPKIFYIGIYGANKKSTENRNLKALIEGKDGLMFKANHEVDIRNVIIGLKKAGYKVVLVGYSRGGNAAINVANRLGRRKNGPVTIDQLITFDPHSLSDKKVFNLKYNNVKSAHNFYQKNKRTGGKFGFWGTNPYQGSQVESGHIQVQETSFTGHKRLPGTINETDVSHLNIIRHSVNNFGQDIGLTF